MASPNIASQLETRYGNGSVGTVFNPANLPTFRARVTDPDTAAGALNVRLRVFSPGGQYLYERPMTHVGNNIFEYQAVYAATPQNEIKTLTFGPGITGGTFRVRFNNVETEDIPWSAGWYGWFARIASHPDIGGSANLGVSWNGTTRQLNLQFGGDRAQLNVSDFAIINTLKGTAGQTGITSTTFQQGNCDFSGAFGEYLWDVVAADNVAWTGGMGNVRTAIGPQKQRVWMDVPVSTTNIAPADGASFNHPWPTLSWQFDPATIGTAVTPITMQSGKVIDTATGEAVWSYFVSGDDAQTLRSVRVPGPDYVKNGRSYEWQHRIYKRSLVLTSWTRTFQIAYTPPATVVFGAPLGPDNAWLDLSWNASSEPDASFRGYVVKVREAGVSADSPQNRVIKVNPGRFQTTYRLWEVPYNTDIIVSVLQRAVRNGETVDGIPYERPMRITQHGVIIANPATSEYVHLPYHTGRSTGYVSSQAPQRRQPWNLTAPVAIRGRARSREMRYSARLAVDGMRPDPSRARWRKVEALYANAALATLLWKDEFGDVIPCLMDPPTISFEGGGIPPIGDVQLFEVAQGVP